ncbi:uncharacterized protein [Oscarella lobularis]|uniref:uncharacterized protein n=1 Tax=Oscarella lobularis TaxID=121494 RepID=UPI0033143802
MRGLRSLPETLAILREGLRPAETTPATRDRHADRCAMARDGVHSRERRRAAPPLAEKRRRSPSSKPRKAGSSSERRNETWRTAVVTSRPRLKSRHATIVLGLCHVLAIRKNPASCDVDVQGWKMGSG